MANSFQLISVVIPIRREASADIVLSSLKQVNYPLDSIEVFVAEGIQPSRQRNEAIKRARGEIIFFFDDDSIVDKELFNTAIDCYRNNQEIAAIGGPSLITDGNSLLEKSFACILTSIFGVFRIRARYKAIGNTREATEQDLILCNFSIRKAVLEKEGGFDERLYPNEETELIRRLISKGYKLTYNPDIIVYRDVDKTLTAFCKRLFNYGCGRMEQIFIRPSLSNVLYFIPLIFLFYLCFIIFNHNLFFIIPILAYVVAAFTFGLLVSVKEKEYFLIIILPFLFFATHISYGLGLFWGFINKMFGIQRFRRPKEKPVVIKKLNLKE